MENFKDKFDRIIAETLSVTPGQITPQAKFKDDLGADSLDMVELLMNFETEFGLTIPDGELDKIVTVADAEAYLVAMTKTANG